MRDVVNRSVCGETIPRPACARIWRPYDALISTALPCRKDYARVSLAATSAACDARVLRCAVRRSGGKCR